MPNNAFFNLFHKQKKFTETCFTKLSANPYAGRIATNFTNRFSVICLGQKCSESEECDGNRSLMIVLQWVHKILTEILTMLSVFLFPLSLNCSFLSYESFRVSC